VNQAIRLRLSRARGDLAPLAAHLAQLSPLKILDRGYAIVERDGKIVKSPADAPQGSEIQVRVAQGRFKARVTS
jgi:exodeoxyribonuclease VII large subunit